MDTTDDDNSASKKFCVCDLDNRIGVKNINCNNCGRNMHYSNDYISGMTQFVDEKLRVTCCSSAFYKRWTNTRWKSLVKLLVSTKFGIIMAMLHKTQIKNVKIGWILQNYYNIWEQYDKIYNWYRF
jgi:CxxC motif-containing protein